jgi:hypothetical protein
LLGGCTIFNGKQRPIITSLVFYVVLIQQVDAVENTPVIHLFMKPNICVLSETEAYCEDLLVAEWKSANNKNYSLCLYQSNSKTPIECWQNTSFGKTEFTQTIAKTTLFELRDMGNQTLLGQESFQVINAQKSYQRSRRNPWSFF